MKTRSLHHMINLSLFFIICSFTLLPFLHCTNYTIIVFTFPSIQLLPVTHSSVLHYLHRSIKGACITIEVKMVDNNVFCPLVFLIKGRVKMDIGAMYLTGHGIRMDHINDSTFCTLINT